MGKNITIGVIIAVVAVVILTAVLLIQKPTAPQIKKMYIYHVSLGQQTFTAVFIPLKEGVLYGMSTNASVTYFLLGDNLVNVFSKGPEGEVRRATYYSRPMELCINSTQTLRIAGESLTLTSSQCTPAASPIPTVKTFEEAIFAIEGLPSPRHWVRAGVAQTPYGQAVVYTNTTTIPIFIGLNAVLDYEKQQLPDGTVYMLKIKLSYGTQTAAVLTYTLSKISDITPEMEQVIRELSKNVMATDTNKGLDVLKIAEKIGMTFDGEWPAVVIFFDLWCPYCAQLFRYNYTLLQGHRLVLVDLIIHEQALLDHQRLRCLYKQSPSELMPKLREIYTRLLNGDVNFTADLPTEGCPVDAESARRLATALVGQNIGTPMTVVIYPNGTYRTILGYDPSSIAKALGK